MGKDNKIALTYSIATLLITFIVGQILLSLYPDGNTIGSSILFILMNLVPMIVAIIFAKYEKKKQIIKNMFFFAKRKNHCIHFGCMQCDNILWSISSIRKC